MKKTLLIILSLIGLSFAFADDATMTWDTTDATSSTWDTTTVEATTTETTTYDEVDKNKDGTVDEFENCLFVEKKTKKECAKYNTWMMMGRSMWSGNVFSGNRPHMGTGMAMYSWVRADIYQNRQEIWANWEKFHSEWGFIGDYLKADITTGEKAEVKTLIETHAKEVKDAVAATRKQIQTQLKEGQTVDWTWSAEELKTTLKVIQDKYVEAIMPYIDPAKQEDFKKFIEAREATVQANAEYRKNIITTKVKAYKYLSEKIRTNFIAKIESLSDEQIQSLIDKVDSKIEAVKASSLSQSKKVKTIAILNEIKSLLEDQLSSDEEDVDQEAIIEEITE